MAVNHTETVDRVGLALVGVGEHARRNLLPAIAATRSVRLVGLSSRDEQVRTQEATRWKCRSYSSASAMLEDPEVDVVYVAVPVGLHAEYIRRSLRAAKHVWCEKSLAATKADWNDVLGEARSRNLALCEAHMFRFHPQFARVQALIAGGVLGRLRSITGRFGFPHMQPQNCRYSRELGGGALLDAGAYVFAAARLLYESLPTDIFATLERDTGYEVDTGGAALLRFGGGEHAHLEWGFGRCYTNEISAWGEDGKLCVDRAFSKPPDLSTTITLVTPNGTCRTESVSPANHFTAMLDAFADTVTVVGARQREWTEVERQGRLLFGFAHNA